ncbi:MAG: OsmC family peroxiredoxin [Gaiellaceae bacterium]
MPRIERNATVVWEGNIARGAGAITAESGAFTDLPFTLPSRIGDPEGKTSPEELLAAATAGCFAMSLGSELARDGTPPERLEVDCRIVMDEVPDEGHQIVGTELSVRTEVDGASEESLRAALERADAGCPFSTLLKKAGASVTVTPA